MTPSQTHASGPGTLTNDIYDASLPPAVLALLRGSLTGKYAGIPYNWLVGWFFYEIMSDGTVLKYSPESIAAGQQLLSAAQLTGWPIDNWIQIMRNDPVLSMDARVNAQHLPYGPPYGSGNVDNPNDPMPNQPSNFPSTMPAGWIKYSTDAADYPPYPVPVVPPTTIVWTPNPDYIVSAVDPGTGVMHYYWDIAAGQNPTLGTPCTYLGMNFIAANIPGTNMGLMSGGIYRKGWMLTGAAG